MEEIINRFFIGLHEYQRKNYDAPTHVFVGRDVLNAIKDHCMIPITDESKINTFMGVTVEEIRTLKGGDIMFSRSEPYLTHLENK